MRPQESQHHAREAPANGDESKLVPKDIAGRQTFYPPGMTSEEMIMVCLAATEQACAKRNTSHKETNRWVRQPYSD